LSRYRKVKLSRSKAFVIAAAGALSVATAASATATTWTQEPQGPQGTRGTRGIQRHPTGSAGPAETSGASALEAVGAPRLTLTDQLAIPIAGVADQPSSAILMQRAYQVRLAKTQDAIARRKAAQRQAAQQAAELGAKKAAVAAAAATQGEVRPSQAATDPETSVPAASGSPQQIAEAMLGSFGWSSSQFSCLDPLWAHESGWSVSAYNAGSGAFGIPQALPGSKMASAGPDWQTDAATQIKWGLEYIKGTYGSPCSAWTHEEATGSY
jgi:hypothetical protein